MLPIAATILQKSNSKRTITEDVRLPHLSYPRGACWDFYRFVCFFQDSAKSNGVPEKKIGRRKKTFKSIFLDPYGSNSSSNSSLFERENSSGGNLKKKAMNRKGVRFLQKTIGKFIFSRYLFRTPSNHSKNLKNGISEKFAIS